MSNDQLAELKSIVDKLALLGPKPNLDNQPQAASRLALLERFERLVRNASLADRRALCQTLKQMLAECQ